MPDIHEIKPPEVPDSHVAFAKAVADLAVAHGIDRFEMTFRPDWEQRQEHDINLHGDMKIIFASTDGRGRPSRDLKITLEAILSLQIENEPKSFN